MVNLETKNNIVIREFSAYLEIEESWVTDEGEHRFSEVTINHEDIDKLVSALIRIKSKSELE